VTVTAATFTDAAADDPEGFIPGSAAEVPVPRQRKPSDVLEIELHRSTDGQSVAGTGSIPIPDGDTADLLSMAGEVDEGAPRCRSDQHECLDSPKTGLAAAPTI